MSPKQLIYTWSSCFYQEKKMTLNSKEKKYQAKERKEEHPEAYNAACAARMKKSRDNKAAAAACVTPKTIPFSSIRALERQ